MEGEWGASGAGGIEAASVRSLTNPRKASEHLAPRGPQPCVTAMLELDIMIHVWQTVWAVAVGLPTAVLDATSQWGMHEPKTSRKQPRQNQRTNTRWTLASQSRTIRSPVL